MRLQEYGRNPHTRKAYVQQPDLLMVGVEVSKAKHHACLGTPIGISRHKLESLNLSHFVEDQNDPSTSQILPSWPSVQW